MILPKHKKRNKNKLVKGKIVYTKGITFSSSKLLNQFSTNLSSEQKIFLTKIKKLGDFEYIKNQVDKMIKY